MKIVAIKIRGEELDGNGFQKYIWATKKQVNKIMGSQYTDDRDLLFQLGDHYIRARDIVMMKEMELSYAKELPCFENYIVKQIEREELAAIEARANETEYAKLMRGNKEKFLKSHNLNMT